MKKYIKSDSDNSKGYLSSSYNHQGVTVAVRRLDRVAKQFSQSVTYMDAEIKAGMVFGDIQLTIDDLRAGIADMIKFVDMLESNL